MAPLDGIDVVVLAGGMGTRLRPIVANRPKVLAPVGGRPFLDRLLELLAAARASRVVLALGYRADQVVAHLEQRSLGGPNLIVSIETQPMGTGGALALAARQLRSDPVIVMNGDSYAPIDFARLLALHRRRGARATLALVRVDDASRFGAVRIDPRGRVVAFEEKRCTAPGPGLVSAGIYAMQRTVIDGFPTHHAVSLEHEVFPRMVGDGLYGIEQDVPFIDIGTPESYAAADGFFAALEAETVR